MDVPRVSVLLPARDAAATLGACLRSLIRQTLRDWECVVVDDGSRDETAAIAAAADPRIRVIRIPHAGVVAAAMTGLGECRAPLVARMDADDVMHRGRLALQVTALDADPGLAAVGAHVRFFPRRDMTDGLRAYELWLNGIGSEAAVRTEAFVELPVANPTLCGRRSVLTARGYRDHGWPEDYDLLLRMLAAGDRIGIVPRRLLGWRDHPRRLTRTHASYTQDRIVACKAHYLANGILAGVDRYVLWGYGGTGRALRRALALHGKHPSHIVELHAGRLGNRIHGAPVVPPEALDTMPRAPLVASVAGDVARRDIRAFLGARGWVETRDYVCAA
ncbi:MAG TPA: glycosyltransferase family 2 protein [Candidatus Binatia bacterium]|jgi:glycosyltransferase involved in cell wall biosynthesis|nr:glycosyltransferase family 2 protein [Candidatus Binatia bacterium]